METISGTIVKVKQRWNSANGDVLICTLASSETGDYVSVKMRERRVLVGYGSELVLYGKWTSYTNKYSKKKEKQFDAFAYGLKKDHEKISKMFDLLAGKRFPRTLAVDLVLDGIEQETVERNPFVLMSYHGCGFKRCDKMWLDLGRPKKSLKRSVLCLLYEMENHASGSVWFTEKEAIEVLTKSIPGADFEKTIRLGWRAGLIETQKLDDHYHPSWDWVHLFVASKRMADMEQRIHRAIMRRVKCDSKFNDLFLGDDLTEHQREQAKKAISRKVGWLCGGGGTGKTFTLARIVTAVVEKFGKDSVLLCAPTGKAAVRIAEVMMESGLAIGARTIHSLIGFTGDDEELREVKIPEGLRLIVVDETSMVDIWLMDKFLQKFRDVSVLFVGDPYQLLPVGPGAPFRDCIESQSLKPFIGELTETLRNAGKIVECGNLIRQGKRFSPCSSPDEGNLVHLENSKPSAIAGLVISEIRKAKENGFDPLWDVQVICQVNRNSMLSTTEINKTLQAELNPNRACEGTIFTHDDKVINTKNSWLLQARGWPGPDKDAIVRNGEMYVANGEIGQVVDVLAKYMVVHLPSPSRHVMVPRWSVSEEFSDAGDTGSKFSLGYAITVHKSQGSQWPVVICVVDPSPGAKWLTDRSLVYTALSRAKSYCVTIGPVEQLYQAIKKNSSVRRTGLSRLIENGSKLVLEGLPS